ATRFVDAAQRALAADRPADELINAVRGHLSEVSIIAARGLLGLAELAAIVRDEKDQRLPVMGRAALMVLVRQIEIISTEICALDTLLRKENKASELGPLGDEVIAAAAAHDGNARARRTRRGMMSIGRSSRRENLLSGRGCRAHVRDQDLSR